MKNVAQDEALSQEAVRVWQEARESAVNGDAPKALSIVRSADSRLRARLSWRLFELHQLGLMNQHEETLGLAENLIADLLLKPVLDPNERYFLTFAQWYGQVAYRNLRPGTHWPTTLDFDTSTVNLSEISLRWKIAFPMPIHTGWEADKAARRVE